MTAFDQFEVRLRDRLDDLASPHFPDYFDDVLARAVSRRQRPAWTFPERWIPMSSVAQRPVLIPGVPWRMLAVLLSLLALLAAGAVISMGLRQDRNPAPPFGLAQNGVIAYLANGDIFTRDLATGEPQLLIGGPSDDVFPQFSRDGLSLAFIRLEPDESDGGTLMVANADGTDVRSLFGPTELDAVAWAPTSDEIAVISTGDDGHGRVLSVVPIAGGAVRTIEVPVEPLENVEWRPPDGHELIFQARDGERRAIFAVQPDGSRFRQVSEGSTAGAFTGAYEITADGAQMFYTRIDTNLQTSVRVLDLETGEQHTFAPALPPPAEYDGGVDNTGSPSISPDGQSVLFIRFWNASDADGKINEQMWIASIDGDGADARPVGPVRRIEQGVNPIYQAFAPDGKSVLLHAYDESVTWVADPTDGSVETVDWGVVQDPPTWQRRAP